MGEDRGEGGPKIINEYVQKPSNPPHPYPLPPGEREKMVFSPLMGEDTGEGGMRNLKSRMS